MIDKMYINYVNKEEKSDIIVRSNVEDDYWYVMDGRDGDMYHALPDDNKDYAKQPYMANDVPIYNVKLDKNGALQYFTNLNGKFYGAGNLKKYLDDNLDNQHESVEFLEDDPVKDMVSSEFEYKIDKVNSALGALTFMEWQGVSHDMVMQAMNDVRDNIDAFLKTNM